MSNSNLVETLNLVFAIMLVLACVGAAALIVTWIKDE